MKARQPKRSPSEDHPINRCSILVVDDDPLVLKVLTKHLASHDVDTAHDLSSGRHQLEAKRYDLCFIDLSLGREDDCSGFELVSLAAQSGVYPVVMSGHDSDEMVDQAYALGCRDFYAKGNEAVNAATVIARFLATKAHERSTDLPQASFVTRDPATRTSVNDALHYAVTALPILILGPSGTGKTSLAKLIHDHSGRAGRLVSINCAAYNEELLEAELFGYRKGAFSGAAEGRKGQLLLADGGTLFLDEIGSMSLKMQTKLLKAIEEHVFYPLGSDRSERADFRVISATIEDLQSLIRTGRMRFDFFHRIHGLTVELTPLAARPCDIFPLIKLFTHGDRRLSFTAEAKQLLMRHGWPGNVRELRKTVEILGAGREGRVSAETVRRLLAASSTSLPETRSDFVTEEQYRAVLREGLPVALDRFADGVIRRSLQENAGRKNRVLSALRISTRLLYASINRCRRSEP